MPIRNIALNRGRLLLFCDLERAARIKIWSTAWTMPANKDSSAPMVGVLLMCCREERWRMDWRGFIVWRRCETISCRGGIGEQWGVVEWQSRWGLLTHFKGEVMTKTERKMLGWCLSGKRLMMMVLRENLMENNDPADWYWILFVEKICFKLRGPGHFLFWNAWHSKTKN